MAIINSINLFSLDGSNGFRVDGVAADDFSGSSVSNAGDVNGDGFDDVIIGATGADPNGDGSGSSYVVFGKAAGFHCCPVNDKALRPNWYNKFSHNLLNQIGESGHGPL